MELNPPSTTNRTEWGHGYQPLSLAARWVKILLLFTGCMLMAGEVVALGLGDLVVHSRPGKPLRASIPLTIQEEEELAQLHVTMAPTETYEQQQLVRPSFLEGMHIGLLSTGKATARIQLFGVHNWQGEEAVLLLDLVWPQGQLARQFHLAGVSKDTGSVVQDARFVEVGENETLDAIAMRLSEGSNRSYMHMMYALFLANPDAFYNGNMNNLKGGVRLRVPTEEALYRLSDVQVFSEIRQQYELWRQQREQPSASALSEVSEEQAAAGELKGESRAPHQQLQQLADENESLHQRNEELKERLARLEEEIQQVTEQVIDYQPAHPGPEPEEPEAVASPPPVSSESETRNQAELPGYILLLAMVLALGAGILVWRNASAKQGRES